MVIFTNGRLIISPVPNFEAFEEAIKEAQERAREQIGNKKIVFKALKEPFDCFENSNKLSFQQLKECMPEYVEFSFKAIGRESVTLPAKQMKDIKHIYTPEEKETIAEDICELQNQKELLIEEKKEVTKSFSAKIESKETALSENSKKYRQGYEWQTKECSITLDFIEKQKHFSDSVTGVLLHTEPLTAEDQRSLFDMEGFVPGENMETAPEENTEEKPKDDKKRTTKKANEKKADEKPKDDKKGANAGADAGPDLSNEEQSPI